MRHEAGVVTGLVRDVSLARDLADTVARGFFVSPEQNARLRLTTASVAAAIRQQAHVMSSICELHGDASEPDPGAPGGSRNMLAADARSAAGELIMAADLLRDYTDGCLKLEPQRWPVPDIIARAMPGMKRLLERHGVHLAGQTPPWGAALNADLSRVAILLQLAARIALPAMTPGHTAGLACTIPSGGGIAFTWSYEGVRLDETLLDSAAPCPSPARATCIELMHPAIGSSLMQALLQAHDGSFLPAPARGSAQAVTLHLHDLGVV
jgi:hypothetical protein